MKHLFISLLTVLVLFFSCQKAPELTITSPTSIELSAEGGSASITFTANRDWTASCSESWIHISISSSTASKDPIMITVSGDANTTYDDRSATVTIRVEEVIKTVIINQPQNLGILVPTSIIEFTSPDAQVFEVDVQANVQYTISVMGDWIEQVETKALVSNKLKFNAKENQSYDKRLALIVIKPENETVSGYTVRVLQAGKPVPEGAVDLGIRMTRDDGSTYRLFWAECNIGATAPEESGDYYAWGEIDPYYEEGYAKESPGVHWKSGKTGYDIDSYPYASEYPRIFINKYCPIDLITWWDQPGSPDGLIVLEPQDDVAHVQLGGAWRMPTSKEWEVLKDCCTWVMTTRNGINGYEVTGSSNSIFIPATGTRDGQELDPGYTRYWSSSLDSSFPISAFSFLAISSIRTMQAYPRYVGMAIRPVTE